MAQNNPLFIYNFTDIFVKDIHCTTGIGNNVNKQNMQQNIAADL